MRVRFWGTRGSIPKPGPDTLRYGGNTSCGGLQSEDGTRIILDCGSGAQDIGLALQAVGTAANGAEMFARPGESAPYQKVLVPVLAEAGKYVEYQRR